MCGIFGVIVAGDSKLSSAEARSAVRTLFKLSESRGKEASGLALADASGLQILKRPVSATKLLRTDDCRRLIDRFRAAVSTNGTGSTENAAAPREGIAALIGHSRLVTDGIRAVHNNNQPVVAGDMIGVHNGIVVNADDLWARFPQLERLFEVDSEVIFKLLRKHYLDGNALHQSVRSTFELLRGTAAIATFFADLNQLLLATNNGSLYIVRSRGGRALFFASERYFLEVLAGERRLRKHLDAEGIVTLRPATGCVVDLSTLAVEDFTFDRPQNLPVSVLDVPRSIVDLGEDGASPRVARRQPDTSTVEEIQRRYPFDETPFRSLRRCSRCILPETIPYIVFDAEGVCNFCRMYRRLEFSGQAALRELVGQYRRKDGKPDCIVAVSGGRDSTYGLHYMKNVLGMNPVAFTYDWAMVTDLARRNVARICGKLGVEHILLSADIPQKRDYIRKNVLAWLERPHLGLIPLFMAGDKAYFYNAYKLRKKTGIDLLIMCENMLERDFFKASFAGAAPELTDEDHIGHLPWTGNLKMILFYLRNYLANPRFLNSSIPDTVFAYLCYFVIPRDYHNLFRFIPWDEERVVSTLIEEYDWELATDTTQTWRIGDGTSPFYNFIYYNVAGFSENDNFYSNQIREGTITREEALAKVREMNRPRFEGIKWYCETIGIDFAQTVARISEIPKLYETDTTLQER